MGDEKCPSTKNGHRCVRWAGHLDLHWTIGKFTGWTDAGADPEPHVSEEGER